jgi:hypothetical protein
VLSRKRKRSDIQALFGFKTEVPWQPFLFNIDIKFTSFTLISTTLNIAVEDLSIIFRTSSRIAVSHVYFIATPFYYDTDYTPSFSSTSASATIPRDARKHLQPLKWILMTS